MSARHGHLFAGLVTLLVACASAACGDPSSLGDGVDDPNGGAAGGGGAGGDGTNTGATCDVKPTGRAYTGFGKTALVTDRANENLGVNRARVKPYGVLAGEYQRTLGATPASLASEADTFGEPGARWYEEAALNAVSMATAFDVAFEGCLTYTKDAPDYAAAPTDQTASATCTAMMNKFWDMTPSPDQIASCSKFATTGLAKEPDARRKWSYVCASVLTSTRFLTF